jgi:glutamate-ammonia-ligase adenylyltransferase
MRQRMAAQHKRDNIWNLKQQRGGIVDVEFIVQYLLLRHGAAKSAILHSNPIAALGAMQAAKLIDQDTASLLIDATKLYATLLAVSRLAGKEEAGDPEAWPPALRRRLPKLVGAADFNAVTAQLSATQQAVRALFERLVEKPAAPYLSLADSLNQSSATPGQNDHGDQDQES